MSLKVTKAERQCDLGKDDGPAVVFRFAFDGHRYEADLCAGHASQYRTMFRTLARAGRRRREKPRTVATRQRTRDIRAWGRREGYDLPDRGRLPAGVVAEYEAAEARETTKATARRRAS